MCPLNRVKRKLRLSLAGLLFKRAPVEIGVYLLRGNQMLQLLQSGETTKEKHFSCHLDMRKDLVQLASAEFSRPPTPEFGEVTTYLIEGRAIASIVRAPLTKGDSAAFKYLPHSGGDFADAVILPIITNVEDLVVHGLTRCFESNDNRLTDVINMDQRSPWCSIARHLDLFGSPGESGKIIEDNIETHTRTGAECCCVAQEHGRKTGVSERADITFDQHFALGIDGLRIGCRSLVALDSVLGRTIDAA